MAALRNAAICVRKPAELKRYIKLVNDTESEADEAYADAMYRLFAYDADYKTLAGNKEVYGSLEECCDMCEEAADVVEQIIIRNT